jgi:hypothetical protein
MTVQDVEEIYDLTRIHDEYIVSRPFDRSGNTHGWTKATVVGFEIDEDDEELIMIIESSWGEKHRYGWSKDNIVSGPLATVCKAYDYPVSDFERLQGEDIWLKVRYITLDEDGNIDSGTRMNYSRAATGPNHWKRAAKVLALTVLVIVALLVIL